MSKADDLREWVDRLFEPPETEYVPGWCQECDQEVSIATGYRPFGMAETCGEHWPLSELRA